MDLERMKSFNKFIEEMASSAFASGEEQPQPTALQKAKEKFAAKKAAAVDKVSELKDKAKQFGGKKLGKVKTRFTKQSGERM
jgi:hypothetical protein|tara:strand:+ start:153 stop:398 length:246 start_codon:yes stop_codon:yes gene_type:complete